MVIHPDVNDIKFKDKNVVSPETVQNDLED